MNQTQIAKVTAAYSGFLDAGTSYAHVMQEAAKALGGTPCSTLLAALAAVHAAKYKCNFTWNKSGDAVFYNGEKSTRETRNSPARMSWTRNVMVWFKADKAPHRSPMVASPAKPAPWAWTSWLTSRAKTALPRCALLSPC